MHSEAAAQALKILRQGEATFQWYVIPLFALVVYVYAVELERRNWNLVFAGLAFWGMDWFNEVCNGLVFHFTRYAPLWGTPGRTAYLLLIGLNIEICFMFALAGIVFAKLLPRDRHLKLLGLPNRFLIALAGSLFCVLVEVWLNHVGALTWDYPWWSGSAPWLIVLFGYLPLFLVSFWVFDLESVRRKALAVGALFAFDAVCLAVFAGLLVWI